MNQPSVLLWLTHAYCRDEGVQIKLERCVSAGILRPLVEESPSLAREFRAARQSVVAALAERPFDIDPRYVWVASAQLNLPHGVLSGSAPLGLLVGSGRCVPGVRVVFYSAIVCLREPCPTEMLIAIAQSFYRDDGSLSGLSVNSGGIRHPSVNRFLLSCAKATIEETEREPSPFRITELRRRDGRANADAPSSTAEAKQIYGLLTADEGWDVVPAWRARQVTANRWSSRDFLWVGSFGQSVLVMNDKDKDYVEAEGNFFKQWFGSVKPYYSTAFRMPGLDHGVLYATEGAALLKLTADALVAEIKQTVDVKRLGTDGSRFATVRLSWRELMRGDLNSMRLRIFKYIDDVRTIGVEELEGIDHLLSRQFHLQEEVKALEQYGAMIDAQIVALATIRLSVLVMLLTALGTLAGVLALLHL